MTGIPGMFMLHPRRRVRSRRDVRFRPVVDGLSPRIAPSTFVTTSEYEETTTTTEEPTTTTTTTTEEPTTDPCDPELRDVLTTIDRLVASEPSEV